MREKLPYAHTDARVGTMYAAPFASAIPRCWEVDTFGDYEVKALNGCGDLDCCTFPRGNGARARDLYPSRAAFSRSLAVWPLRVEGPSLSHPSVSSSGWCSSCNEMVSSDAKTILSSMGRIARTFFAREGAP